jgi:acyl carrier protein
MMDSEQIRNEVKKFILENFLFRDNSRMPAGDGSLIENGVLDSTGILELIDFLEERYSISIEDQDTTPSNLDSIDNIVRFTMMKTQA